MGDLTKNFSKSEVRCRCGCGFGDTHGTWALVHLERLQALRDIYDGALHPNSGGRCTRHNEAVGGSTGSQHKYLTATDIRCNPKKYPGDPTPEKLRELGRRIGFAGIGIYDTFCHVDSRPGPRVEWDERT